MFIFNKRGRRKYIHVVFHHFMKQRPCYEINIERNSILSWISPIYILYLYITAESIEWNGKTFSTVNYNFITQMLSRCKNATVLESLVLWIVGLFKNNFISCKYHNFVRSASRIRAETSQTFLFRIKILMVIFYRNRMTLSYPLCFRRLLLLSWWQLLFSSLFKRCCICLNLIDYMYLYMPI